MLVKYRKYIEIALFFLVAAALYLPFAHQFGYYNDDWYTMYAARVAGPEIFREIYSIDRPAREFVAVPLYLLFKGQPFYYSLIAYLFRVLGAFSLLWLLRLLWKERHTETYVTSFLFLIYPGFLSMPIAIDFQSHLIGMMCAFLSLGLTVQALNTSQITLKWGCWLGAALLGWVYLGQMEYYIGFELVRLAIIIMIKLRTHRWGSAIIPSLKAWVPYSIIPVFFVIWREFFFNNDRKVTETGTQLGMLLSNPLLTLYTWGVNFAESFINVIFLAWGLPLSKYAFSLDLHASLVGFLLAGVLVVTTIAVIAIFNRDENGENHANWQKEMTFLGIAWVIFGLIPVILANRSMIFAGYSRYGFVSSVGGVMFLAVLLSQLQKWPFRMAILAFLVFSASFTHYGNGKQYADDAESMRTFWWQVSWRVPQMQEETTIIADYYKAAINETSFVWGPANQIYYPVLMGKRFIRTGVYALLLNQDTVTRVLTRQPSYTDPYNIVRTFPNFRKVLIITQPSPGACVHVIDGRQPEYSTAEQPGVMMIGSYSDTSLIQTDASSHIPPAFLFGTEPAHDWCYYYQVASLARQKQDWDAVIAAANEAQSQGFMPQDPIEWMPFLQAYLEQGNTEKASEIARMIAHDRFVALQACQIMQKIPNLPPQTSEVVIKTLCK